MRNFQIFATQKFSKIFSWSSQNNRTPVVKQLSQTPFFRFRLRANPVIESFLLKLKTITTCFEHDIFHNNLKGNIMVKPILTNIAGCYRNRNWSSTFLWGQFTSKSFNKLSLNSTKLRHRWFHEGILKKLRQNFRKIVRTTYAVEIP